MFRLGGRLAMSQGSKVSRDNLLIVSDRPATAFRGQECLQGAWNLDDEEGHSSRTHGEQVSGALGLVKFIKIEASVLPHHRQVELDIGSPQRSF